MAEENREEAREKKAEDAAAKAGETSGVEPEQAAEAPPPVEPAKAGEAAKPVESGKAGKAAKAEKAARRPAKDAKPAKGKKAPEPEESPPVPPGYVPRALTRFREVVAPALQKRFGYRNQHQIPKLAKIVVNMGVGEGTKDSKLLDAAVEDLATITGQRPAITKARKSVASFKVRKGMSLGCKVTLRGMRMYEFFDRLVTAAIPRIRDFRGLSPNSFDGHGNYTFGIREQIVFPEIDYDKVVKIMGMDITIATTCKTDEEALELLKGLGMPFRSS